jgi:hypothetical protein
VRSHAQWGWKDGTVSMQGSLHGSLHSLAPLVESVCIMDSASLHSWPAAVDHTAVYLLQYLH